MRRSGQDAARAWRRAGRGGPAPPRPRPPSGEPRAARSRQVQPSPLTGHRQASIHPDHLEEFQPMRPIVTATLCLAVYFAAGIPAAATTVVAPAPPAAGGAGAPPAGGAAAAPPDPHAPHPAPPAPPRHSTAPLPNPQP